MALQRELQDVCRGGPGWWWWGAAFWLEEEAKDMSSTSLVVLGDTAWEEYIITIADIYGCLFCSRHWPKPYSYSVI